jgi:hypothetical protein
MLNPSSESWRYLSRLSFLLSSVVWLRHPAVNQFTLAAIPRDPLELDEFFPHSLCFSQVVPTFITLLLHLGMRKFVGLMENCESLSSQQISEKLITSTEFWWKLVTSGCACSKCILSWIAWVLTFSRDVSVWIQTHLVAWGSHDDTTGPSHSCSWNLITGSRIVANWSGFQPLETRRY